MPRDIPVGNGHMLVNFDEKYRLRDLYFPYVGQENHAGADPCHFGVWGQMLGKKKAEDRKATAMCWTDSDWEITLKYRPDTLVSDVRLVHPGLAVELQCNDVVDFNRPVLVRRIKVVNLTNQHREVHLFHNNDFWLYGTKVSDTAYFDPQLRSLIHYRKTRYISACFYMDGDQRIDEYATGTAGFRGHEGTWRDAEDGHLMGNPIAQGAVDSTMMCRVGLTPHGYRLAYLIIGCGHGYEDMDELHRFLHRVTPEQVVDRTDAYWRLWVAAGRLEQPDGTAQFCAVPTHTAGTTHPHHPAPGSSDKAAPAKAAGSSAVEAEDLAAAFCGPLPPKIISLYKRSLLVVRTQIDNHGAIIAANDSDIMQFSRDTYSYLWPRDGAFVADAMDAAGFPHLSRQFFAFCARIISHRGCFLHKYNPDGSPASSWHPWVMDGHPVLPIQEDETALVIWALWRHYQRYRDIEFVRPMWVDLVRKAADFLVLFRDPDSGLPLPSWDLWEERFGVHTFTVGSVYAGLEAARQFAVCFGDTARAARYAAAARGVRDAACRHLYSEKHRRFLRRITPTDTDRNALLLDSVLAGRSPRSRHAHLYEALPTERWVEGNLHGRHHREHHAADPREKIGTGQDVAYKSDEVIDASMAVLTQFDLLALDDERLVRTMEAIEKRLTVKTDVGGVARYEDDYYHQVSDDVEKIPGNPWFICTLWLADWRIARATTREQLDTALPILEWVADRALPSGVLAEQVHPLTNAPLSVSPLTWSHATVVATLNAYMDKLCELSGRAPGGQMGRIAEAVELPR